MRVLPGVVGAGRHRRLAAAGTAVVAVVTVAALTGCSQFDAALGQRQAVVTFKPGTTVAQRMAVRAACAKTPNVTPQPLPSNTNSAYSLEQVIYQVNQASNADVALLEKCLAKFPAVVGITLQDSTDMGG